MTTKLLKDTAILIGTAATAIALVMGAGTANATNAKSDASAEATAKATAKSLNVNVLKQIQAQGQGQAQKQQNSNDNRDNFEFSQKYEAAASSGAISLGQGSFGAAAGECWSTGRGQSWGFGGTGGTIPGTGSGLFNRATTEESVFVNCWAAQAAADMYAVGKIVEAEYLDCMDPFKRLAMKSTDATACNSAPVIVKAVIRPEDESLLGAISWPTE